MTGILKFHDVTLLPRAQTKYQIVLTKTDTVFPIDVARRAMQIEEVNFRAKITENFLYGKYQPYL